MKTTVKNIGLALKKDDIKMIQELMEELGLSQSEAIKRAIAFFYEHKRKKT